MYAPLSLFAVVCCGLCSVLVSVPSCFLENPPLSVCRFLVYFAHLIGYASDFLCYLPVITSLCVVCLLG